MRIVCSVSLAGKVVVACFVVGLVLGMLLG